MTVSRCLTSMCALLVLACTSARGELLVDNYIEILSRNDTDELKLWDFYLKGLSDGITAANKYASSEYGKGALYCSPLRVTPENQREALLRFMNKMKSTNPDLRRKMGNAAVSDMMLFALAWVYPCK